MRRRWYVALGTVAGVALAAVGVRVWLPSYRPSLQQGETYGIDVSHHQGAIDWRRVADDGIAFAYLKATEGRDHVDRRYAENASGARAAGIETGAYHFFTLCTSGAEQAAHFVSVAGDHPLPPAVDLELAGNCAARPSRDEIERSLTIFLDAVETSLDERVVLYVGDDFADRYFRDLGDREAWVPSVLRRPRGDWLVWQASAWARVDGIEGGVDLDVGRFR